MKYRLGLTCPSGVQIAPAFATDEAIGDWGSSYTYMSVQCQRGTEFYEAEISVAGRESQPSERVLRSSA